MNKLKSKYEMRFWKAVAVENSDNKVFTLFTREDEKVGRIYLNELTENCEVGFRLGAKFTQWDLLDITSLLKEMNMELNPPKDGPYVMGVLDAASCIGGRYF